jgi:hypothetical protein
MRKGNGGANLIAGEVLDTLAVKQLLKELHIDLIPL